MQLSEFLNNIAYLFLLDEDFQKTADLAGINWNQLPEFDAVKIVKKYLALRGVNAHRVAISEMRDDVSFLEMTKLDLQKIGSDEEQIAAQLKKYFKAHQYKTLAENILKHPEKAESLLQDFDVSRISSVSVKSVSDFLPEKHEEFLKKQKEGKDRVLIPGFKDLSEMIGGFNYGRIIMILGETGFGKTNFALNLLVKAATKYKCLFVNMEMPLEDISNRLVVLTTKRTFKELYSGQVSLAEATGDLPFYGNNLKFTEGYSLSLQSIEALMRKEKQNGLDFVVIDYDQKIDLAFSRNIPEWKLLQSAIQHIENVAKELKVCVILLAQVNRDGVVSASHRSTFTAHTVLNFKSNDSNSVYNKQANAMIVAEKNRHGKKDQASLVYYNDQNLTIKEIQIIDYKKSEKKNGKSLD